MVVGIVIAAVIVGLVGVMLWADRRDRARGHVNRGFGDIRSTLRNDRQNIRNLRRIGSYGSVSPHQLRDRGSRRR